MSQENCMADASNMAAILLKQTANHALSTKTNMTCHL